MLARVNGVTGFFQKRRMIKFWKWFMQNQVYRTLSGDLANETTKQFQMRLSKVNPGFRFQIETDDALGRRRLILYCQSAEVVPIGQQLLKLAPLVEGWTLQLMPISLAAHLRQIAEAEERLVDTSKVFFTYDVDRKARTIRLDIYVNPEGRDQETIQRGVYANIRKLIGEDKFNEMIREIYIRPIEQKGREDRLLTFPEILYAVKHGF